MSLELETGEQREASRVWFLSPAIVTVIFFAAQLFVAGYRESPRDVHAAAALADSPTSTPVEVRVVSQIRPLEESAKPSARVPESESELLRLFDRQGCVVFSPSEVEDIGTLEQKFGAEEVGVITADKLRRARFVR